MKIFANNLDQFQTKLIDKIRKYGKNQYVEYLQLHVRELEDITADLQPIKVFKLNKKYKIYHNIFKRNINNIVNEEIYSINSRRLVVNYGELKNTCFIFQHFRILDDKLICRVYYRSCNAESYATNKDHYLIEDTRYHLYCMRELVKEFKKKKYKIKMGNLINYFGNVHYYEDK